MRLYLLLILCLVVISPFQQSCTSSDGQRILVFSYTKGYRHASIESGQAAIKKLGQEHGFEVTVSEDPTVFTDESLSQYAAIVFLSTTGDILNPQQEAAFMRYIQAGGGYVGVHAAADTEYSWPWYGKLAGAYFHSHPKQANAAIKVTCDGSPACKDLPAVWSRWDEWYNYRDMQPDLQVIAALDETSYQGGNMQGKHPIAWYHEFDGGRAFYTGLGHTDSSYVEPAFLGHLLGGIEYAMDHKKLDYTKAYTLDMPEENRFEKSVLATNLDEPMQMDIMKDGSVLIAERKGTIKLYNPSTGLLEYIARMPVHTKYEDGLLGLVLDPGYESNHYVYMFYSPVGDIPTQHVSRFVLKGKSLDMASEKIILKIPVQRDECCHSAGYLKIGGDGLLYISVGDNTNPFASDGFNPIDERPGRMPWDAQKSASNTNDLRGKILRIRVMPDGTYEIPEGNLFKPGTPKTRPEIFVMGCRNPFRFSIDDRRKLVHWGDVGPDAGRDSLGRGPKGYDFFGQVGEGGGYFGWPYIRGNGHQYNDYDFATGQSGPLFDPNHLVNNSPNNTGMTELPPYKAPKVWYSYDRSREFPFVETGGKNPMGGPVYYKEDYIPAKGSFPDYFDGKLFIYEWMRRWIYVVSLDKQNNFIKFDRFMEGTIFANPMDMKFGPDGALYVLNYGTKWFAQNEDAQLFKIEFNGGNRKPVAKFSVDKYNGAAPMIVNVDASESTDADRDDLSYTWLVNGIEKAQGIKATMEIPTPGTYDLQLKVTDKSGATAQANTKIQVGNDMPLVDIEVFGNKTFFWPGRKIPYSVSIQDKEDGSNETGTLSASNIQVSSAFIQEGQDLAALQAGGHLAGMNQSPNESGRLLIEKSDCKTCHSPTQAINGPSFTQIAQRYQGKEGIDKVLAHKIITGGTGNWGDRAMAAHPQLSEGEVKQMVNYILSFAGGSQDNKAAISNLLSGVAEVKSPAKGNFVISASYTDRGYNGIPSLSNQAIWTLKYNSIQAADADIKSSKVTTTENNGTKSITLHHNDYIGLSDIDFKDLKGVVINYASSSAGKLEVRLDDPEKGIQVGELIVSPGEQRPGSRDWSGTTDLKFTKGIHSVYFVFKADGEDAAASFRPLGLEFKFPENL